MRASSDGHRGARGGGDDPLFVALAPALVGELGDVGLRLARASPEAILAATEALDEPARAAGWCLGVLACAGGADALLARRERDGTALLLAATGRELARRGRAVELPARVPEPHTGVADGWRVPYALARLLWECAAAATPPSAATSGTATPGAPRPAAPAAAACRFRAESAWLVFEVDAGRRAAAGAALARELEGLFGGAARARAERERPWQLALPADWFGDGAKGP